MRDFDQIAQMRRKGWRPLHVTMTDQPTPAGEQWWAWAELLPFPLVQLEQGDQPEMLDLRALVGLPVLVDFPGRPRFAQRVADACTRCGAQPLVLHQEAEAWHP